MRLVRRNGCQRLDVLSNDVINHISHQGIAFLVEKMVSTRYF